MDEADDEGSWRPTKPRPKMDILVAGASDTPPAVRSASPQTSSDALSEFDRRIAGAPADELSALIQARGAIIQQDEWRRDGAHQRRGQIDVFYAKVGFSIAAAAGGAGLIVAGFGLPGFFLLGGAAAVYVPEYVKDAISKLKPRAGDA